MGISNQLTGTLDKAAAAASLACAIHCIALPMAIALLPVLGLAWLDNPWVDRLFLTTALVFAALAHPKGYNRHRRCLPAAMAACGLIGISLAISLWGSAPVHHYVVAFGGLLLASSHFLNRHWCKCACHEES
jgi:hypothetical protein